MEWLVTFFAAIIILAVGDNLRRKNRRYHYELTPNCLMTKWPLLFVTGKRSVFYFQSYWNILPEFMTEHGYEVFHLHLPWQKNRSAIFTEFLTKMSAQNKKFHLIVDSATQKEFASIWEQNHTCIQSLTCSEDLTEEHPVRPQGVKINLWTALNYKLHNHWIACKKPPSLMSLGLESGPPYDYAQLLLKKFSHLAEDDLEFS